MVSVVSYAHHFVSQDTACLLVSVPELCWVPLQPCKNNMEQAAHDEPVHHTLEASTGWLTTPS